LIEKNQQIIDSLDNQMDTYSSLIAFSEEKREKIASKVRKLMEERKEIME
jgi:hypothetical protein